MRLGLFTAVLACLMSTTTGWTAPKVVVSIVPLHGIVSDVMAGVGEPQLLLQGKGSEHQASYSPEQLKALGEAQLVLIIGQGLELKLAELSGSESVNGKGFVKMSDISGLVTYPIREGGAWEAHDHEENHGEERNHDHEAHAESFDPHIWLDPRNAALFAEAIADELVEVDSPNAKTYSANAEKFVMEMKKLEAEISTELASVKQKPFIVFHDAFQYFERRFELQAAGSVTDISATAPSAKRLKILRQKVKDSNAVCAFAEPQFSRKALEIVTEGAKTRTAILDGIGADITPGPGAYQTLLRNLAKNLKDCLSAP